MWLNFRDFYQLYTIFWSTSSWIRSLKFYIGILRRFVYLYPKGLVIWITEKWLKMSQIWNMLRSEKLYNQICMKLLKVKVTKINTRLIKNKYEIVLFLFFPAHFMLKRRTTQHGLDP